MHGEVLPPLLPVPDLKAGGVRHREFEHAVTEKITVLETVNRRCRHNGGYPRYILDLMRDDAQALMELIRAYRREQGCTDEQR